MTHRTVRDVMTRDVVTVATDTPYREILDLTTERRVSALPVRDESGTVVGMVSETDLLHRIEFSEWPGPGQAEVTGRVAAELMSTPAVTIGPDASVVAAAKLMDAESVKRLPVLNERGVLIGIVSRRDLLRMFLRSDEDLREEVTTQIVRRVLWASPADVQVRVESGVVTLTGTVERRGLIPLAECLVRAVDGVVDVVCRLDYDLEDEDLGWVPHSGPVDTLRFTSPMF